MGRSLRVGGLSPLLRKDTNSGVTHTMPSDLRKSLTTEGLVVEFDADDTTERLLVIYPGGRGLLAVSVEG